MFPLLSQEMLVPFQLVNSLAASYVAEQSRRAGPSGQSCRPPVFARPSESYVYVRLPSVVALNL